MLDINRTMTIFIKEGTSFPANLPIESEAFLPGWRVVKNLDRQALTREVEKANWNFFYLAGEMRATVFGRGGLGALRRAVKCVLAKQEGQKFNFLEITKVVAKRFLGNPFHEYYRPFPTYPTRYWPGPCKGFCLENACCSKRRSGRKAICGSDFKFLGIRGRYENENDAQFNSLFCCPASYGAIALWTGSFQVSALYLWNELDQSVGAY